MSNKIGAFRRELRSSVGRVVSFQVRDGFGASLVPVLERVGRGDKIHDGDIYSAITMSEIDAEQRDAVAQKLAAPIIIPAGKGGKATALVSMRGMCLYDVEYQPLCFSTLLLAQTMNALANDPEIGTIILDIDSPGGVVTGVPEAGEAIFNARKTKRVVALVNPLCASAGYWLASQASEITAVPSADIGSVGVFVLHAECSGMMKESGIGMTFIFAKDSPYKVEGNPFEPLAEDARAYIQGEVDDYMRQFASAIARGRGVPVSKVLSDFGKGRTMSAAQAKSAGMIDRVATINQAYARWSVSSQTMQSRRRGEDIGMEDMAEDVSHDAEAAESKSITFKQVGGETYVVDDEWPEVTRISADLIDGHLETPVSVDEAGNVEITVANGKATYGHNEDDSDDVYRLVFGSVTGPAPEDEPVPDDDTSGIEELARVAAELVAAEKEQRVDAMRRRLSVKRH